MSQQLRDSPCHHEEKDCLRTKPRQRTQAQELGRDKFQMSSGEHLALALPDIIYPQFGIV